MKFSTLILTFVLLSGCSANGPTFQNLAVPTQNKSIVYFYRQAAFYGAANCPNLIINGNKIGCLKNGGFLQIELEQGEHTVLFDKGTWEPDKDLRTNFSVESGKVYFYEYGQVMTGMFATASVVSISGREDFYRKTKEYSLPILKNLKKS